MARSSILLKRLANLQSVHLRQHQVQQDKVRQFCARLTQGLPTVLRQCYTVARLPQIVFQQLQCVRLVINN